jgi:hypothetical protein
MSIRYRCNKCKNPLQAAELQCPKCGSKERDIIGEVNEIVDIIANQVRVKGWLEIRLKYLIPTIAVTMGSPVVGYFLDSVTGMVLGLGAGGLSLWIGAEALTKVKEIVLTS